MKFERGGRWRWTLIVLALCLVATVTLYRTHGWIWLGVPPIGEARMPFSDAAALLGAADFCNAGAGQWIGHVCYAPSADAIPYSLSYEPWLTFQRWGLRGDRYIEVSSILIGLFYVAFGLAFRPTHAGEAILLLLFFFSAAVQLAVERANFDLLTSATLCLSAWLLGQRRAVFAMVGCMTLGFDTVLKLYAGLSCACAGIARRSDRTLITLFALLCSIAAIAFLGVDTLFALGQGAAEGGTRFSTGAHWLWRQRGITWMLAAATSALLVSAIAWRILRGAAAPPWARYPRRTALMKIAFLTAIPLFLLKDSYDYRFVLWLPCLALPVALLRRSDLEASWRYFCIAILGVSAFVFCAELPCMLLDRFAAPGVQVFSSRLIEGITLTKQVATWNIAGLLTVLFLLCVLERPARTELRRS
ncbi:MAG: hypothetical protein ABIO49_13515 [Dokdonella sp.]